MDITEVESVKNVCIFGLGFAAFMYGLYKGGTFIERKLDESDRLEREVLNNGDRKPSSSGTFRESYGIRRRA
ncbi:hypothetical protein ORM79_03945 [Bacillus cereus]|uniref:hypothetical protein n=1 Tax=Bacillus cereus group TaxID=86661 RepID=UPI0001A12F1F|nr:hypothetical protein [Bacillus cereus]EEL73118.1 hypothetical protein bcere0027_56260 [Bacillus cereus AH676]KMP41403.1 hypothetical protein TU56_27100 [Bacillus cereus]MDZ4471965.1 hypothetical protein [Bacillus cereus]MEB9883279.1 hypothetical protein [Bacillus cereus]HDR4450773.1 hypothetical protein [Bacillus cereus]